MDDTGVIEGVGQDEVILGGDGGEDCEISEESGAE